MSQTIGANLFKRATKKAAKLRLALIGPPGSGKTYSALLFAMALAESLEEKHNGVALIDTERGSASKYADLFGFDVLELSGSFHPQRYVEAIKAAESAGYGVLVVDSLSHAWIGEEGGLDLHDKAVARQKSKNSFTAWGEVTPHHNKLVQAMIQCKAHLIGTMRSKVEYVQGKDASGKPTVRKVGTAPLMRDGLEYEFDVVGDLDTEHNLVVTKSRCPAIADKVFNKPGRDFIGHVAGWLGGAPTVQEERQQAASTPAEKKSPSDGAEFVAREQRREQQLVAQHRCQPGELLDHLRKQAALLGNTEEMVNWSADTIKLASDWLRTFLASHPAQTNGNGSSPQSSPPAAAPQRTSAEKAKELQSLLIRKGWAWARKGPQDKGAVCKIFDLPETTMIEDLNPLQYAQIHGALMQERDVAEKAHA